MHSYQWGREHEVALHELSYVPPAEDIVVEYEQGEAIEVTMHDGSAVILKKVSREHDPTDRAAAMAVLEEANRCECLLTGLIYIDTTKPSLIEQYHLVDTPLNRLSEDRIRPKPETIKMVNDLMF